MTNRTRAFLAAYLETGSITRAAEAAGIQRQQHYRRLKEDPQYAAAFEEAREQFGDALEEEAIRRAREGVEEPVYYQGVVCGGIQRYSDGLMQFLLRGVKPEKYRERKEIQHTGAVEIVERLKAARKRMARIKNDTGEGKPGPG